MTPVLPLSSPSGASPYEATPLFGSSEIYVWGVNADRPRTWQLVWDNGRAALRSEPVAVRVHASFELTSLGKGRLEFRARSPETEYAQGAKLFVDRLFWWGWQTTQRLRVGKLSGDRSLRFRVKATANAVRVVVTDKAMAGGWLGGESNVIAPG
jgi:hypothetical protein